MSNPFEEILRSGNAASMPILPGATPTAPSVRPQTWGPVQNAFPQDPHDTPTRQMRGVPPQSSSQVQSQVPGTTSQPRAATEQTGQQQVTEARIHLGNTLPVGTTTPGTAYYQNNNSSISSSNNNKVIPIRWFNTIKYRAVAPSHGEYDTVPPGWNIELGPVHVPGDGFEVTGSDVLEVKLPTIGKFYMDYNSNLFCYVPDGIQIVPQMETGGSDVPPVTTVHGNGLIVTPVYSPQNDTMFFLYGDINQSQPYADFPPDGQINPAMVMTEDEVKRREPRWLIPFDVPNHGTHYIDSDSGIYDHIPDGWWLHDPQPTSFPAPQSVASAPRGDGLPGVVPILTFYGVRFRDPANVDGPKFSEIPPHREVDLSDRASPDSTPPDNFVGVFAVGGKTYYIDQKHRIYDRKPAGGIIPDFRDDPEDGGTGGSTNPSHYSTTNNDTSRKIAPGVSPEQALARPESITTPGRTYPWSNQMQETPANQKGTPIFSSGPPLGSITASGPSTNGESLGVFLRPTVDMTWKQLGKMIRLVRRYQRECNVPSPTPLGRAIGGKTGPLGSTIRTQGNLIGSGQQRHSPERHNIRASIAHGTVGLAPAASSHASEQPSSIPRSVVPSAPLTNTLVRTQQQQQQQPTSSLASEGAQQGGQWVVPPSVYTTIPSSQAEETVSSAAGIQMTTQPVQPIFSSSQAAQGGFSHSVTPSIHTGRTSVSRSTNTATSPLSPNRVSGRPGYLPPIAQRPVSPHKPLTKSPLCNQVIFNAPEKSTADPPPQFGGAPNANPQGTSSSAAVNPFPGFHVRSKQELRKGPPEYWIRNMYGWMDVEWTQHTINLNAALKILYDKDWLDDEQLGALIQLALQGSNTPFFCLGMFLSHMIEIQEIELLGAQRESFCQATVRIIPLNAGSMTTARPTSSDVVNGDHWGLALEYNGVFYYFDTMVSGRSQRCARVYGWYQRIRSSAGITSPLRSEAVTVENQPKGGWQCGMLAAEILRKIVQDHNCDPSAVTSWGPESFYDIIKKWVTAIAQELGDAFQSPLVGSQKNDRFSALFKVAEPQSTQVSPPPAVSRSVLGTQKQSTTQSHSPLPQVPEGNPTAMSSPLPSSGPPRNQSRIRKSAKAATVERIHGSIKDGDDDGDDVDVDVDDDDDDDDEVATDTMAERRQEDELVPSPIKYSIAAVRRGDITRTEFMNSVRDFNRSHDETRRWQSQQVRQTAALTTAGGSAHQQQLEKSVADQAKMRVDKVNAKKIEVSIREQERALISPASPVTGGTQMIGVKRASEAETEAEGPVRKAMRV